MKKFYCQDCGSEVSLNSESCPSCNKIFGSVLCPKCEYSGASYKFENGCPKCGYLKNRDVLNKKVKTKMSTKIFTSLLLLLLSIIIFLIYIY
ncbi:MAG: hypothetical protein OCD02_08910 [Spirochaetaceae bacterium]